jgi:hypothetical protein
MSKEEHHANVLTTCYIFTIGYHLESNFKP